MARLRGAPIPQGRLVTIGRYAVPMTEHLAQRNVGGDDAALGGAAQISLGLVEVPLDAGALKIHLPEIEIRRRVAGLRRFAQQFRSRARIGARPGRRPEQARQFELRRNLPVLGRLFVPGDRTLQIFLNPEPFA